MSQAERSTAGRVLGLLLAGRQVSGAAIGGALSVSRAAVSKAVAALREAGFQIDSKTGSGYLLRAEPKAVLPARLEARLPEGGLGLPYRHFAQTDSTNLQARRWAEDGAPHGALVAAEFQSAGRGRLDRGWQAPAGSCLLFSLILKPRITAVEVFGLTTLASLAICQAVEDLSDLKPRIKWPNDVFLDGKKLVGVLTEFTCRAERADHVVVGAGINVNLSARGLAKLPAPAASLAVASGREWDRAELLAAILTRFGRLEKRFLSAGREELAREYGRRSLLTGRMVEVRDRDQVITGLALGLAANGALLIKGEDGREQAILQGDVSLLSY